MLLTETAGLGNFSATRPVAHQPQLSSINSLNISPMGPSHAKNLWTYLASTLMYPFHKKLPEERISTTNPALRPVTVGSVITRFGCRILVRMNRLAVAEVGLLSHQFSFGIKGGVQHVIMGMTLSLQLNPNFVDFDRELKNAHTFSSRDKIEEELESDVIFHHLLEVFGSLYGMTVTPQRHYGDG